MPKPDTTTEPLAQNSVPEQSKKVQNNNDKYLYFRPCGLPEIHVVVNEKQNCFNKLEAN